MGDMGGPGLVIICSLPGAKPPARGVDMWCGAHFLVIQGHPVHRIEDRCLHRWRGKQSRWHSR